MLPSKVPQPTKVPTLTLLINTTDAIPVLEHRSRRIIRVAHDLPAKRIKAVGDVWPGSRLSLVQAILRKRDVDDFLGLMLVPAS
jgi:hypothetical protein